MPGHVKTGGRNEPDPGNEMSLLSLNTIEFLISYRCDSFPLRLIRDEEGGFPEALRRQEVGVGAEQGGWRLRRGSHPG